MKRDGSHPPTVGEVKHAAHCVGGDQYPKLVFLLHDARLLTAEVAATCVVEAWVMANFPDRKLFLSDWRKLFKATGYTVDGVAAHRPPDPLVLYRGAVKKRRAYWSWTDDLDTARSFVELRKKEGKTRLWTATVESRRLLAYTSLRDERAYIVDTRRLSIGEYQESAD